MTSFCTTRNKLSKFQSCFGTSHSTTTALLKIVDDLRHNIDQRQILARHSIHKNSFPKAAQPVWVLRFSSSNCVQVAEHNLYFRVVKCLQDYRYFVVCHRIQFWGHYSFPFMVNDISHILTSVNYHIFEDNLQIYYSADSGFSSCFDTINKVLQSILIWASNNSLLLNASKQLFLS